MPTDISTPSPFWVQIKVLLPSSPVFGWGYVTISANGVLSQVTGITLEAADARPSQLAIFPFIQ